MILPIPTYKPFQCSTPSYPEANGQWYILLLTFPPFLVPVRCTILVFPLFMQKIPVIIFMSVMTGYSSRRALDVKLPPIQNPPQTMEIWLLLATGVGNTATLASIPALLWHIVDRWVTLWRKGSSMYIYECSLYSISFNSSSSSLRAIVHLKSFLKSQAID